MEAEVNFSAKVVVTGQSDDRISSMSTIVPSDQNPFASRYLDSLPYQFLDTKNSLESLLTRWEHMGHRAAIVGPCGYGKSTLLDSLRVLLHEKGYTTTRIRLSRGEWRFTREHHDQIHSAIQNQRILLLDGVEQLTWPYWTWLKMFGWPKSVRLLITSHVKGRLPTLIETKTSPALLGCLIDKLLPSSEMTDSEIVKLFNKHHGNVRMALLELYDRVSTGELKTSLPIHNG
jgi:energy-coupling factor transporter ATP-binding protein EcfA2